MKPYAYPELNTAESAIHVSFYAVRTNVELKPREWRQKVTCCENRRLIHSDILIRI
jgi:hypothetical protein